MLRRVLPQSRGLKNIGAFSTVEINNNTSKGISPISGIETWTTFNDMVFSHCLRRVLPHSRGLKRWPIAETKLLLLSASKGIPHFSGIETCPSLLKRWWPWRLRRVFPTSRGLKLCLFIEKLTIVFFEGYSPLLGDWNFSNLELWTVIMIDFEGYSPLLGD